jgi:hypothetical protein
VSAPDYIEPFVAWRVWEVDAEFRLRSVMFVDVVWTPHEALVATCWHLPRSRLAPWRKVPVTHRAPGDTCGCGIHGASRRTTIRQYERFDAPGWAVGRVVGLVMLWGSVLECERGWRASHAYPSRFSLPIPFCNRRCRSGDIYTPEELAVGLSVYGVPVDLPEEAPQLLPGPLVV